MKILTLLSQKGGSGKTTLAVHLAVAAEAEQESVVIIDTDPQASATAWASLRANRTPEVTTVTPSEIGRVLPVAQEAGKTLAVIDTAPHASVGATKAASLADFILIPCRPTAFDLAAIQAVVDIVQATQKPAAFVLNACPARAVETREARETLLSYGFPVAPMEIGERRSYARAIASGKAVTEFDAIGKSSEEIKYLWQWIREKMA